MAVTAKLYSNFFKTMANKEIDLDTDVIKVALATSTYTPSQTAHDYFNDITNEVTGTGYTAGGATLASKTVGVSSLVFTFDAADTSWTTSTITARYAIVYDSSPGTAATNPLILYVDFGADVISSGGTFSITWDSLGLFTLTAA